MAGVRRHAWAYGLRLLDGALILGRRVGRHLYQFITHGPLIRLVSKTLLRRIMFANLIGLAVLLSGVFYLAQYRAGLIEAQGDSLKVQGESFATLIASNATREEGTDLRECPRREHEAEVGGAAEVEHGESERDRHDVRAEEGNRTAREEEPEVAVTQRAHRRRGYASAGRLSRVRTPGTARTASVTATPIAAAPQRVARTPICSAIGPARASPTGTRPSEPSAS